MDAIRFLKDLLTNLWVPYVIGFSVTGACLLVFQRWRLAAVALGLAAAALFFLRPHLFKEAHPTLTSVPAKAVVRIVLMNVSSENHSSAPLLEYLRVKKPDLIGLIEINSRWQVGLSPLFKDYAVQAEWPEKGSFGLGLFSRTKFLAANAIELGRTGVPSIEAHLPLCGKEVTVVLTHPYPPITPVNFGLRNGQLADLAAYPPLHRGSFLVMGDLNTTPFSPYFSQLVAGLGAKDSRTGFGLQASWPSFFHFPMIPIDHVLVSPDFRVLRREIGPDLGSDHYPVYLEVECG